MESQTENVMPAGAHLAELSEMILLGLQELQNSMASMETGALNWRPLPGVNSIFVLASHITGQTEEWICQSVGEMQVDRNRDAEFRSEAHPPVWAQELTERIEKLIQKIERVLQKLKEADLNRTVVLRGKTKAACTVLYCLVHVIQHTNSHLAEIRMLKHLYDAQKSSKT